MLKDRLTADLKSAMLAKDAARVSVLRSLKSAITYAEVAAGSRESGLNDAAIIDVFTKEAKKRQESADSFKAAGRDEQAATELSEKAIIEEYLPRELSAVELRALVDEAIAALDDPSPKAMGQVIGAVKARAQGRVDGGLLARLTKEGFAMIILMGVAGGGKSTQGRLLADEFGYAWISTGEILRVVITGTRRREMLEGKLLSDDEMIGVMDKVLGLIDKSDEFILDGFPRTVVQAKWLMKQVDRGEINLTAIIHLNANEQVVHDRLKARGRIDDTEDAIAKRFAEYRAVTMPILDHLRNKNIEVLDVDASQTPEQVHDLISDYLVTKKKV